MFFMKRMAISRLKIRAWKQQSMVDPPTGVPWHSRRDLEGGGCFLRHHGLSAWLPVFFYQRPHSGVVIARRDCPAAPLTLIIFDLAYVSWK
jgi:hypothetical protein